MPNLPRSIKDGPLKIGKWTVHAHVLDSGMRVMQSAATADFFEFSSMSAATTVLSRLGKHPSLKSLPSTDAALKFTKTIKFTSSAGKQATGIDAESVVAVCRFLLKAREYRLLDGEGQRAAFAAESLIVSIANVGLAALIDEATGYQEVRQHDALQVLLDKYLKKEHAIWAKRFPDEFYIQLFRLKDWPWRGRNMNPPGVVGTYTKDIVYARLAPGVLSELERVNPSDGHGNRTVKHHQYLTEDIGHPALQQHLFAVIVLMRSSKDWNQFRSLLKKSLPRKGDQLDLLDLSESDLD